MTERAAIGLIRSVRTAIAGLLSQGLFNRWHQRLIGPSESRLLKRSDVQFSQNALLPVAFGRIQFESRLKLPERPSDGSITGISQVMWFENGIIMKNIHFTFLDR
jgi:hypothetical protein